MSNVNTTVIFHSKKCKIQQRGFHNHKGYGKIFSAFPHRIHFIFFYKCFTHNIPFTLKKKRKNNNGGIACDALSIVPGTYHLYNFNLIHTSSDNRCKKIKVVWVMLSVVCLSVCLFVVLQIS